jgi:hypothetical protein
MRFRRPTRSFKVFVILRRCGAHTSRGYDSHTVHTREPGLRRQRGRRPEAARGGICGERGIRYHGA